MRDIKTRIKNHLGELIRLQTKPKDIAAGVSLGVFIGFLPVPGLGILQLFIALFFSMILRVNKIAVILGTFITNPLTVIPISAFSYDIGAWLLKSEVPFTLKNFTVGGIIAIAKPLLVGSFVVGLAAAVVSYVITYYVAWAIYRSRRRAEEQKKEIP